MDYEQFYRYLDTRPTAEIKACLQSVTDVAKAHSITLEAPTKPVSNIVEAPPQQHRLEISQQVWFQHAVWGRFGSKAEDNLALPELEQAALNLCTTEKVAEFIVGVNKSIDQKFNAIMSKSSASNSDGAAKKAHPSIVTAVNTTPHTPRGAHTPQTSRR